MSNLTVQRLGEESQLDNEPHRLDYVRRDQGRLDPALHTPRMGYREIAALGIVLVLAWLIITITLWIVEIVITLHVPESFWTPGMRLSYYTALIVTFLPAVTSVALLVVYIWRWIARTRAEVARASITRDAYSNPVSTHAVLMRTPEQDASYFWARQNAEIAMAPYKQLPAGLDSLSNSQHYNTAGGTALVGPDGEKKMPFDEFWGFLLNRAIHLKMIGESGSGKTTLCKALAKAVVNRGDQLVVLTGGGLTGDWGQLNAIGGGHQLHLVAAALEQLFKIQEEREREADQLQLDESAAKDHFGQLWVFVDELTTITSNAATEKIWERFIRNFGSRVRVLQIHLVIMAHADTVSVLGTSGAKALGDNLKTVRCFLDQENGEDEHIIEVEFKTVKDPKTGKRKSIAQTVDDTSRVDDLAKQRISPTKDSFPFTKEDLESGVRCGVNADPDELLDSLLSHTTPHGTRSGKEDTIEKLVALRQAGISRPAARAMGYSFDDHWWAEAGQRIGLSDESAS